MNLRGKKMFLVKQITVNNHGKEVLNSNFIPDVKTNKVFTTLILGENGTGKSFLLKTLADIFIYLEKAKHYQRKPRFRYEQFTVHYFLNGDEYKVDKISGRELVCEKNGEVISLKELNLPQKVLAVSFMVNDKFLFVDSKERENEIYEYLGVRKTTNATYTSSVVQNVLQSVVQLLDSGLVKEINKVLNLLHFDSRIEIIFAQIKNKKTEKKRWKDAGHSVIIECNTQSIDVFEGEMIGGNTIKELLSKKEIQPVNISFFKNDERIRFEDCSSGEKHMLFAFSGVLNSIKDNSLILIDEPEISLHPEWQIQYITLLKKVFSRYEGCHFILASHSHYLVSDLEGETSSIVTLSKDNDCTSPKATLLPYNTFAWSAENIIYNVFGLRTTRNYYFERDLHSLLSMIQNYEKNTDDITKIKSLVNKLKQYIYNEQDPLKIVILQAEEFLKCIQKD